MIGALARSFVELRSAPAANVPSIVGAIAELLTDTAASESTAKVDPKTLYPTLTDEQLHTLERSDLIRSGQPDPGPQGTCRELQGVIAQEMRKFDDMYAAYGRTKLCLKEANAKVDAARKPVSEAEAEDILKSRGAERPTRQAGREARRRDRKPEGQGETMTSFTELRRHSILSCAMCGFPTLEQVQAEKARRQREREGIAATPPDQPNKEPE